MILNWVAKANLQYDSFQAGNEANGESLYICTASVPGIGHYPGKYSWTFGRCSIGVNGNEVLYNDFSVLTNNTPPLR
jgi:hypothetical protein